MTCTCTTTNARHRKESSDPPGSSSRATTRCSCSPGNVTGPTVTVVVPTLGRSSLARSLRSCSEADEIIVIADETGDVEHARAASAPFTRRFFTAPHGLGQGYAQREIGMLYATSTHLAFLDDDDIFLPDALDTMRVAATTVPVIFRMNHPLLGVVWREPQLVFGNVGTPMLLVPNRNVGRWRPHYEGVGGDFTFIQETCLRQGDPVWNQTTIAQVRPE